MRKIIYFITLIAIIGLSNIVNAQTSIANGNWSSPSTWGGYPPTPGSTVVINHNVTLDMDWGYTSGSITINVGGALNGIIPMRGLSISGGAGALTVNGTLNIARVALFSGTIINNGTFQNDSLYITAALTNNLGATINASQLMINTNGTLNNNGSIVSSDFLNVSTVTNTGTITTSDFMNSKSFTNSAAGEITTVDFLNSDSLANPAVFTNNGRVTVSHDWANIVVASSQINGSGKFCIQHNTYNSGAMSGTFDFCDQTGGNVDLNIGTIAGTITYCQFSCATGINENLSNTFINLYPNPSKGIFTIELKDINAKNVIEINNVLGEKVYFADISAEKTEIDLSSEMKGIYFYQIKSEKEIISAGKIIIE